MNAPMHYNHNKEEETTIARQETIIVINYGRWKQKWTHKNQNKEGENTIARQESLMINDSCRGKYNETKNTKKARREEGGWWAVWECVSVRVRGMCIDLATVAAGESRSEALRRSLTPIRWLISPD